VRAALAGWANHEIEPDLVLLDLGLAEVDGVEVCRGLRRWMANPIIVLTADDSEERKVEALDICARDAGDRGVGSFVRPHSESANAHHAANQ